MEVYHQKKSLTFQVLVALCLVLAIGAGSIAYVAWENKRSADIANEKQADLERQITQLKVNKTTSPSPSPSVTPTTTPAHSPSPTAKATPAGWKEYRSTALGISFAYNPSWGTPQEQGTASDISRSVYFTVKQNGNDVRSLVIRAQSRTARNDGGRGSGFLDVMNYEPSTKCGYRFKKYSWIDGSANTIEPCSYGYTQTMTEIDTVNTKALWVPGQADNNEMPGYPTPATSSGAVINLPSTNIYYGINIESYTSEGGPSQDAVKSFVQSITIL